MSILTLIDGYLMWNPIAWWSWIIPICTLIYDRIQWKCYNPTDPKILQKGYWILKGIWNFTFSIWSLMRLESLTNILKLLMVNDLSLFFLKRTSRQTRWYFPTCHKSLTGTWVTQKLPKTCPKCHWKWPKHLGKILGHIIWCF